jgi:hypothetical protein
MTGATSNSNTEAKAMSNNRLSRQGKVRMVARCRRTSGTPQTWSESRSADPSSNNLGTKKISQSRRSHVLMTSTIADSRMLLEATMTSWIPCFLIALAKSACLPMTGTSQSLGRSKGCSSRKPTGRKPYSRRCARKSGT